MAIPSSRAPDDERVCPRCGEPAEPRGFCRTCGLNLWEQAELPRRSEWNPQAAAAAATAPAPAPPAAPPAAPAARPRTRWADRPRWVRSLVEVGLPIAVVVAVALIVFLPGGGAGKVPGAVTYDHRANPLLVSMRAQRVQQLTSGQQISAGGGGCTGSGVNWACDLRVQDPKAGTELETYEVRWNQNGCWGAVEDCVSKVSSALRLCPPPKLVVLRGCITPAQAAATG